MPMTSPHDLFMHELADIYDAEQRLLQVIPQLASECTEPQAQQALQQHLQETQQQVQNLEQCFQALGTQPTRQQCYVIQGLKQEHDAFLKEGPSKSVLTMFDLGAAAKTEHYEIAAYRGLVEKAQLMGHQKVVPLLQKNLQQEEAMAQRVEKIAKQLGQQAITQSGTTPQPPQQPTAQF